MPINKPSGQTSGSAEINVKEKSFDELFQTIDIKEMQDNVSKFTTKDYTVITAGDESKCNSMTAAWAGWGWLFEKPVTWAFIRESTYTLEFIRERQSYTMAYFPDQYKGQVLFLGSRSGRDSDKMEENTLTSVITPSGNISYTEARLIIECKAMQITRANPDDYYSEEWKSFIIDTVEDELKDCHNIVIGVITIVWVRK